jgi:DNA-binding HxlR family transcriptional regulator
MPKLNSRRVDTLLEDVIGCRWSISVLRAVGGGVHRPGALERHIAGISTKVLTDRLRQFNAREFSSVSSIPKSRRAWNTG